MNKLKKYNELLKINFKSSVYKNALSLTFLASLFIMSSFSFRDYPSHPQSLKLAIGEHTATINGFQLHYYVRGKGPVMLVPSPGWGPSVNYLIPLGNMEKYFKVVYFDTRHSGKSTGPSDASGYTLDKFVSDIESFQNYLSQKKIFLAGHSAAGHVVLTYAIEHSDRLNGVVSIDAIADMDSTWTKEMMGKLQHKASEPYYKANPEVYKNAYEELFRKGTPKIPLSERMKLTRVLYLHDPSMLAKFGKVSSYDDSARKYTDISKYMSNNLLPELHKITVPTLIINGDDDYICGADSQARRIHEHITSSKLVIIKNSGHYPWKEQPEQFNMAIANWVNQGLNFISK